MNNNDGVYIEVFVVKDGTRINVKTMNTQEVGITLTNSLMDGLEKIVVG